MSLSIEITPAGNGNQPRQTASSDKPSTPANSISTLKKRTQTPG